MKGSIQYRTDRKYYYVAWYHQGKTYKIYKYEGNTCYDIRMAQKLLSCMQSDLERGVFRIERYTTEVKTDVIPYLKEWLTIVQPELSPGTYKDYVNSVNNHLVPWLNQNPVQLHELNYGVLCKLLNAINRVGKGKMNVMYCLHACLKFAWRSGRIQAMPPFPERGKYQIVKPIIQWLTEDRQIRVIEAIPEEHRPIFWWLKYHLRRPSEAMALYKSDYDSADDLFIVRRAFSNKQLVERTKTKQIHYVPCHSHFKLIMAGMPKNLSPFFFTNPHGRLKGQHYQHDALVDIWRKACVTVGENIKLYPGTKHSSCTQMIVEHGYSIHEVQMATDHARLDSVEAYAKVEVSARRALLEHRVIKPEWGKFAPRNAVGENE